MFPKGCPLTARSQVMTGSYHNYFRIYDVNSDNDVVLQADKSAFKAKKIGGARGKVPGKKEGLQTEGIDFAKKIVSLKCSGIITDLAASRQLAPTGEHDCHRSDEQSVSQSSSTANIRFLYSTLS